MYKLNPFEKGLLLTEFNDFGASFHLLNKSFNVNHINESFSHETDESGEKKKKANHLYNTASMDFL